MNPIIEGAGYRIIGPIASGGMGKVYKAEHVITRRIEAVKVLSGAGSEEQSQRFLREIQLQASLSHPNIAAVYNAFLAGGDLVMVMELVEGETLGALLARGRLPPERALSYARQALDAVAYAHAHGVIHRDISPANILITGHGRVKLMDFGLAKAPASPSLSQSGASMGSPFYMSPEQVRDSTQASARSDIYSLGAVLYEMATGRKVFEGNSTFSVMQAQVEQAPAPPIEIDPEIPQALNAAILTALEKDPARRFASADAFRLALEGILSESPPAALARPGARPRARLLRMLALTAAGTAIVFMAWLSTVVRRTIAEMKVLPPVVEIRPPAPPPIAMEPAPRHAKVVAPARRMVEATAPAGDQPPIPANEKKPHGRLRRVLGKIFGPFH